MSKSVQGSDPPLTERELILIELELNEIKLDIKAKDLESSVYLDFSKGDLEIYE
jgi:hypothetical protein